MHVFIFYMFTAVSIGCVSGEPNKIRSKLPNETGINRTVEFNTEPKYMLQRRMMWPEMEETFSGIVDGFMNSARTVNHMIKSTFSEMEPPKHYQQPAASTKVKVIMKTPKKEKNFHVSPKVGTNLLKMRRTKTLPNRKNPNSKQIYFTNKPHAEELKLLDDKTLRQIEREEEVRVEATMAAFIQKNSNINVIKGNLNEFNAWKPIRMPSTEKPYIISKLHTNVFAVDIAGDQNKSTSSAALYEMTEPTAAETAQYSQRFKIRTVKPSIKPYSSTESSPPDEPNYPNWFKQNLHLNGADKYPYYKDKSSNQLSTNSDTVDYRNTDISLNHKPTTQSIAENKDIPRYTKKIPKSQEHNYKKRSRIEAENLNISNRGSVKFSSLS